MDVSTGLATKLASVIVKALFRRWTGSAKEVQDVADILIEQVAGKVDEISRRKAKAQAEILTAFLAERLKPLIEVEFRDLPANDIESIVFDVATTIDEANIGLGGAITHDLDAGKIAREWRQTARRAGRLKSVGTSGEALADVFFDEAASSIVTALQALPSYSATAATEVLRRMTHLLGVLENEIGAIPVALTRAAAAVDEQFERRYRRVLASSLSDIQLYGARVAAAHAKYPLDTAYISLEAAQRSTTSVGTRIESYLLGSGSFLITGDAGSGKTTFLHWLATNCSRQSHDQMVGWLNDRVPFLIRLRRYAGQRLPPPEAFLESTALSISGEAPYGWVHRILAEGRGLLLIDGLDELPIAERQHVPDWLADFSRAFPKSEIIATSRPGLDANRLAIHLPELVLRPMNRRDIGSFC